MAGSGRRLVLVLVLAGCGSAGAGKSGSGGMGGTRGGDGGGGGSSGGGTGGVAGTGTGGAAARGGSGGSAGTGASAGTGGSAGTTGTGAGGSAAAGTTGTCASSGYDIDVPFGIVQGSIKFNGARPPQSTGWANLTLRNAAGDSALLGSTLSGSDQYLQEIVPGTYDLYYIVQQTGAGTPSNSLAKLRSGVVVAAGQQLSLDIDVPATTVSGNVTVNGAFVGSENKSLSLVGAGGDRVQLMWMTIDNTYTATVLPGTYDLYFAGASDLLPSLPKNTAARLRTGIVVGSAPVTLDVDVPATVVSGKITVNGATVPMATGYGWVRLRNADGDSALLGGTFGTSYSTLVVPGTYDLAYDIQLGNNGAGVPGNALTKLQTGIVVGSAPLTLDVDLRAGVVSGTITVNGAQVPQAMGAGNLRLVNAAGDSLTIGSTTTAGTYSRLAMPGTYDLYYALSTLAGAAGPGVPSNTLAKLQSGIVVGSGPVSLDIDIHATPVSGTITVNGAVPSTDGTGSLVLQNTSGDAAVIGTTANAGTYTRLVVPGTYDLYYRLDGGGIGVPTNTLAKLRSGIVVGSTPLTLNIDVPARTVSGTFSQGGTPITGSPNANGNIFLQNASGDRASLGSTYFGTYTRLLIPGSYHAYWSINARGFGVPFNIFADLGCFTVP